MFQIVDEILNITEIGSRVATEKGGQLNFNDFSSILEQLDSSEDVPFEGPDPKVVEFLRILEGEKEICVQKITELRKKYINTDATTVLYSCLLLLLSVNDCNFLISPYYDDGCWSATL